MKQKLENLDNFSFKEVSISETEKELREVNSDKASTFGKLKFKFQTQIQTQIFKTK